MTDLEPIPCKCGCAPAFTEREESGIMVLRLECKCGDSTATLMYRKPSDERRMKAIAVYAWNLNH